ncbi:MAG: hypothetical protein ACJAXJ_002478 [Colwellia sp.]
MKKLSIILLTLSLAACGSGGGESNSIQSSELVKVDVMPIGLWEGQLITLSDNSSIAVAGLIAPNGEIRFITDDGEQDTGVLVLDGSAFSGNLNAYDYDGTRIGSGTITGNYTATKITGSSFVDNVKISTFSLSISDESDQGASLSTIKGNYATQDGQTSIAIDADGVVSGSDTDGCQYSGRLTTPDSSINVYDMMLTVSSCGEFNGKYNGLATYAKPFINSTVVGLVFQVDNGTFSVTDLLIK